jgi:bifunctional DNase/RNase
LIFSFFLNNLLLLARIFLMIISVRVERVTLDTENNRFVVILKDDINRRWLPIVVGPSEAQAIALQLENIQPPRPMTHDLLKNILDSMHAAILRVVVSDLRDNTYFAQIDIKKNGDQSKVDARPSDAIAIALRTSAPIFVDETVMQKASITEELGLNGTDISDEGDELHNLQVELQNAIKEERYEDAARLRDAIKLLEEKPKKKA